MRITEIKIYEYFNERGFTTVGAYTHFDDMKKQGTQLLDVPTSDVEKLQQIINSAKQSKHFQRKLAGGLIFCEIQFADQTLESKIVIGIDKKVAGIMDLTARKDYIVKDSSTLQWLSDFSERMKTTSEKK